MWLCPRPLPTLMVHLLLPVMGPLAGLMLSIE